MPSANPPQAYFRRSTGAHTHRDPGGAEQCGPATWLVGRGRREEAVE